MRLTLPEIAQILDVNVRQVQRYVADGFHGHRLPALKQGHTKTVAAEDFESWLILTGLDKRNPDREPGTPEPSTNGVLSEYLQDVERPESEPTGKETCQFEPEPSGTNSCHLPAPESHCRPAVQGGPITNVPDARSGSWCSPAAMQKHLQQNARDLIAQYGVKPSYDI